MTTENQTKERKRRMRPDSEPVEPAIPEPTPKEKPIRPRGKATTTPKPDPKPAAAPMSSHAGRPVLYEVPVIEGEVDDLPNATGIAKAMYRETIAAVVAKAEAGSSAWTIINPMGRKAGTVQSGIKEAAKNVAKIETRVVGQGDEARVYVRAVVAA